MITVFKVLLKRLLRKKLSSVTESIVSDRIDGSVKSKTAWFGTALIVASALEAQTGAVRALTPDSYEPLVVGAIGFAVIVLRWVTNRDLADK